MHFFYLAFHFFFFRYNNVIISLRSLRFNNDSIIYFSNLSLFRVDYNNANIIRKIINNLRNLIIFLNEREFHLRRDDFISFLKIDFAMKSNENNNKFESKFENFEKMKSNSSKKKEIKNDKNNNDNI